MRALRPGGVLVRRHVAPDRLCHHRTSVRQRLPPAQKTEACATQQLLRRFRSGRGRARVPLVVALLAGPFEDDWGARCGDILQVQRELLSKGADDVVLMHEPQSAALLLSMGVVRAQAKLHEMKKLEAQVFEACEAELTAELKKIESQRSEVTDGFFWQCAHKAHECLGGGGSLACPRRSAFPFARIRTHENTPP